MRSCVLCLLQVVDPVLLPDFMPGLSDSGAATESLTEHLTPEPRSGPRASPLDGLTSDFPTTSSSTTTANTTTSSFTYTRQAGLGTVEYRAGVRGPSMAATGDHRRHQNAVESPATGSSMHVNGEHQQLHLQRNIAALSAVAQLAVRCTAREARRRPTMTEVAAVLTPLVHTAGWQAAAQVRAWEGEMPEPLILWNTGHLFFSNLEMPSRLQTVPFWLVELCSVAIIFAAGGAPGSGAS